jgi:SET domain
MFCNVVLIKLFIIFSVNLRMQTNPVNQNPEPAPETDAHVPGEVRFNTTIGQNALYAAKAFMPGEVICSFSASSVYKQPNYLTVQLGDEEHIELSPQSIQFINHSCSPNVFFNTDIMKLVCLQPIAPGEEFTFFYPSTEWDMAQRFRCFCGHANCLGEIRGAAWIDPAVLSRYTVTAYIKHKLKQRQNEARA